MAKQRAKAEPTIVYQYGCKAPDLEEQVVNQMRLAQRYRNRLCELELQRRAASSEVVHEDQLEEMRLECERLETELEAIYEGRRKRNQELRKKTALTQDEKASCNAIKEKLKPLRKQYVEAKKAAYQSPENRARLAAIDEANKEAVKEARRIAGKEWGLYWGTYTLIEADAMKFRKGVPPRFRGFRGDGQIGVQIQSNSESRLWCADVMEFGGDSHFKVIPIDKRHAHIKILIGATDPSKRIAGDNPPVYATVKATIHRPLPPDAYVSWVRLVRKKIGTNFKWSVQFVLARPEGWAKPVGDGVIGFDDRPELMADGSIRVAKWHGSDGDSGELRLPPDLVAKLAHKPDIQSVHDEKTEVAKKALVGWIKATKEAGEVELPEWFLESTKTIHAWRGASRFAGLIIKWRDNRFDGDKGMFEQMEEYRKDAKHLYNWFAHESTKALNRRRDLYRNFARQLARKYGTVGVRKRASSVVASQVDRNSAVSELREILKQGCLAVVELPNGEGEDSVRELLRAVQCHEKARDLSTVTG